MKRRQHFCLKIYCLLRKVRHSLRNSCVKCVRERERERDSRYRQGTVKIYDIFSEPYFFVYHHEADTGPT